MKSSRKRPHIGIMVTTFRRPESLSQTLESLFRLQIRNLTFEVHVIDNDLDPDVEGIVRKIYQKERRNLYYHAEEKRGVASARNRALSLMTTRMDYLAFIDDDEIATPNWLESLVETARFFGADIVQGPVEAVYEGAVPQWFERGRLTCLGPFHEGGELKYGFSGNVLLSVPMLRATGQVFEPVFDRSGGEDQHFFMALMEKGYRIRTSRDALVFETIPASRVSRQAWLIRRFRIGATLTLAWQQLRQDRVTIVKRVVVGVGHATIGLLACLFPWRWHDAIRTADLGRVAYGVGQVAGAAGLTHASYDKVHVPIGNKGEQNA